MDAPERIGLIGNGLGQWGLATQDEAMLAVHYVRAAEHDRIVAEKDAEIARLRVAIDGAAFQITVLANRLQTHEDDMALSAQAFSSRLRDTAIRA